MTIDKYLSENYGFDTSLKSEWSKYTNLWKTWYKGKVKSFHNYTIYNGKKRIRMERYSAQMAKKCCEDWADLLFNERCQISVSGESSQKQLLDLLSKLDFWSIVNKSVEKAGACGTGALVVSVLGMEYNEDAHILDVSRASPQVEYVDVDWIFPLSWEGEHITECAFGCKKTVKGKKYVYLSVHTKGRDGNYTIDNRCFLDNCGSLMLCDDERTVSTFNTKSATPWFAILSPAGNNNINDYVPFGLPFFANAIDELKAIDIAFDSFVNEIVLGRKRIFVRQDMLSYDAEGNKMEFDDNDVAVYVLPKGIDEAKDLLQAENSNIRADALVLTLRTKLSMFSSQIGMGKDRYDFDPVNLTTATQVISQNGEMFRRKKKHETKLESAIHDIVTAISHAASAFGPYNISAEGLTITFDDSIIEDKEAISLRALREKTAGVLSSSEYRQIVYGETKEVADAAIKEIRENEPSLQQLVGE